MKKEAWLTYNKNLNRLARRRRAALGSRKVNMGLTFSEGACTDQVIYCDACKGPVVNDQVGRRRHAMKNAECKAAMEGGTMEIWKCEAEDDVVYIKAENLASAQARLKKVIGDVPTSMLKWTKIDALPKGEEFL